MPETFAMVLQVLNIQEPTVGPAEQIHTFGPPLFNDIFAAYYKWFGLEVTWMTRSGGRENGLPLINRRAVKHWLRNYIGYSRDQVYDRLNELVGDVPELRDPATDLPHEEKTIPRACIPEEPVKSAQDSIMVSYAGLTKASSEITGRAQPLPKTGQAARQDYLDAVDEAMTMKDYFRNVNGGWKVDEDGKEIHVESCLW